MEFIDSVTQIFNHMYLVWSFILLAIRYGAMFSIIPGLGQGTSGMKIRSTAILVLALVSVSGGQYAAVPEHWHSLVVAAASELLFGMLLGMIPTLIVAGVQTAGQLSSTTMGLAAGQLVDPTLGISVTSLARIFGDLTIVLFLMLGGHYVIIHAVSGLGGEIVPGTFMVTENTVNLLIDRTADIFRVGVMISAPVIVALLLTQFVMGLITKAVPTVNIFIVSFPLTIGIGLILSALSLPEILVFLEHEIVGIENTVLQLTEDVVRISP